MMDWVILEQIRKGARYYLISLFEDPDDDPGARDSPFKYSNTTCDYYYPELIIPKSHDLPGSLSYFRLSCRGLSTNLDSFRDLIYDLHGESSGFGIWGISEIFKCTDDTRIRTSL